MTQHDGPPAPGTGDQPPSQPPPYAPTPYPPTWYGQPLQGQVPHGQVPYGQVPYGQAPYGQPPYGYPPVVLQRTNGMAVASMVLGILWLYWIGSVLALVFGYIAKNQIRERGEGGAGMATAGIVLGWVGVGILGFMLLFGLAAYSGV